MAKKLNKDERALFLAVKQQELWKIEQLLNKGVNPDVQDANGNTPLILCCIRGYLEGLEILAHATKNIDIQENKGFTAIATATVYKHDHLLLPLILADADLEIPTNDGFTPLLLAAECDNPNSLETLLQFGADKTTVMPEYKNNALIQAIYNGLPKNVKVLLNYGIDMEHENSSSETALMYASTIKEPYTKARLECLKLLIANGADLEHQKPIIQAANQGNYAALVKLYEAGANIHAVRQDAVTTTFLAAANSGNVQCMKFLLEKGIDTSRVDPGMGWSLAEMLVHKENLLALQLIIEAGADINISSMLGGPPIEVAQHSLRNLPTLDDKLYGRDATPLSPEREKNLRDIISLLEEALKSPIQKEHDLRRAEAEKNAPKYVYTPPQRIPLEDLAKSNLSKSEILRLQLQGKVDFNINELDENGESGLMRGIKNNCITIAIKGMLLAGANPNEVDGNGNTPLFCAIQNNNFAAIEPLIKAGADAEFTDEHGRNALRLAASLNKSDCVKELIKNKVDIESAARKGWTALRIAATTGNAETLAVLIKSGANIDVRDHYHGNALYAAVMNEHENCIEILSNHGASLPNSQDRKQSFQDLIRNSPQVNDKQK